MPFILRVNGEPVGMLVDDLRTLTLAEAGQLHFELKKVDLAALARHTLELSPCRRGLKQPGSWQIRSAWGR